MKLSQWRRWQLLFVNASIVAILFSYQNCSKNYDLETKSIELPPKCKTGQCITGQINPEIDQLRPSTKVLFVVDNSRTMKLSQSYLAQGVKSLVNDLHGFDADFYVYSTTDYHSKKMDINGVMIDPDDKPVLSSSPIKSCQWTGLDGLVKNGGDCPNDQPIKYSSEVLNIMNPSLVTDLRLKSSDSDLQIKDTSDKLANAIQSVGIEGSSTETGVCSLVRSVYNESAHSFFKKGDNAAMVVVSDENDSSTPMNCLSRSTQEQIFKGKPQELGSCDPKTESCDSVDYEVKYGTVTQSKPYGEVTMAYQCNTLSSNSCEMDNSCDSVKYNFSYLNKKINYTCFDYVPYTITFEPVPTYAQNLKYQCELFEDGVSVSKTDTKSFLYKSSASKCTDGEEISCDSAASTKAESLCLGGSKLVASSCKTQCVVGSKTVGDATYKDTDTLAEGRDLSSDPIIKTWIATNFPGYTSKTITKGTTSSTKAVNTFANLSCSSGSSVAVDCIDGEETNFAKNKCGTKKITSCKVTCIADNSKSFTLKNPKSEDKVNFCSNAGNMIKFTPAVSTSPLSISGTTSYSSVSGLIADVIFKNATTAVKLVSCTRIGAKNSYVTGSEQKQTNTSKSSCDGSDYSTLFDTTSLCTGTGEKGLSGTPKYSCANKSSDVVIKNAATELYTKINSVAGENICVDKFKVGDTEYANLAEYQATKNGRTDVPISCIRKDTSAKKKITPDGVISDSVVTHHWTFPNDIAADSTEANLEKAFVDRSSQLFGENGFFVSAIIRDPVEDAGESDCAPLGADQSYGDKYRSLVESISSKATGVKGDVTSICSKDYSKSLSAVSKWISEIAKRTVYIPEIGVNDEILSVILFKESTGEERTLIIGTDVEINGNKLNFINSAIDPKGWLIKYVYWKPL